MDIIGVLLVAAVSFGLCFLLDRGYTKLFRGRTQHRSGLSVRLSKKYAVFGIVLVILGIVGLFQAKNDVVLLVGSIIVMLLGACLIMYYMTFGVFYDADSFVLTTFGRKSVVYPFGEIQSQQLFSSRGQIIIELYLSDGRSVGLQAAMTGVYPFLDTAFAGWCRQRGIDPGNCPFHDPANSCWFPRGEG